MTKPKDTETDTSTDKKYAIRVLQRLPNGTVGVFYLDALTGEMLSSLDGYELVSDGNLEGGNEVDDTTDSSDSSDSPWGEDGNVRRFGSASKFGGGGGDGGGLYAAKANAANWGDSIFSQLFPSLASWFGGTKAQTIADKVTKSGGVIQPVQQQPTPPVPTAQQVGDKEFAPGAMDMGAGLGSVPPDLVTSTPSKDPWGQDRYSFPGAMDMGLQLQTPPTGVYGTDIPVPTARPSVDPASGSVSGNNGTGLASPVLNNPANQEKYYGTTDPFYGMKPETKSLLDKVVNDTAATSINSGYRDEEHNAAVGGQPGSLHQEGLSFDLDLTGLTDAEKSAVVSELAFQSSVTPNTNVNMGFYSGSDIIHVDSQGRYDPVAPEKTGGVSVMMDMTRLNGAENKIPDWAKEGLKQANIDARAPVPATKPDNWDQIVEDANKGAAGNTLTKAVEASDVNPSVSPSANPQTTAQQINASVNPATTTDDLTNAGTAASYGLSRTPSQAEIDNMARTFAGELSPEALNGVVNNDPAAMAELASMVSTYENRAMSGDTDPSRGSQYNSNLPSNAATTAGNYGLYGGALAESIGDFYNGQLAGLGNTDATHYYNPDIANPSWGSQMTGVTGYGLGHTYGTIPGEYTTDLSKNPAVQQAGADRVNYQYDNNKQIDNSSLTNSAPNIGPDYGANEFGGLNSSNYGSDDGTSGYSSDPGSFDYSNSSGSGSNSGNSYSPASGSLSPGGSGSNSITSSAPSIDTSGYSGNTYSDQEIADNNAGLSGFDGW